MINVEVCFGTRRADGTCYGRACRGKPRSRTQDMMLLRDRLTVMERSIRVERLTPVLADAYQRHRQCNVRELARLEALDG